ncbi:MAG: hypothetical protein AB1831_12490 [Pseudomonadota bacterium]
METLIQTGKTLLNALAFANVGNMREFENLLDARHPDPGAATAHPPKQAPVRPAHPPRGCLPPGTMPLAA